MSVKWIRDPRNANVPEISDDRLFKLLDRFVPLSQHDGKLYRIKSVNPRNIAFTWSPERLDEVKATEIARVKTDHSCGYIALFKPTIAEVLAQVPPEVLNSTANAFYIVIDVPHGHLDEIGCYAEGDGHQATTVFVHIPQ